jgi:hypothetical protein
MSPQFYQAQAGLGFTQAQAGLGEITASEVGVVTVGINAGAGYLVGRLIGYPIAGAVATGALGIVGLLGVAIYAACKK